MRRSKMRSAAAAAKPSRKRATSDASGATETTHEKEAGEPASKPSIIDTIPGFVTIDREWRCTYVSEQVARTMGKTRDELLGHTVWEIFPDADAGSEFRSQCARAWSEQKPVTFEHHSPALGRWYETILCPFPNGLSIQGHDITDRKKTEQALRESELRLRTVLENTPEGYAIYDANRRFEYLNSVGLKLASCKLEDVIGKRDDELWPEAITRSYLPHLIWVYETGLPHKFELDTTAISGDVITKLVSVVPLKDSEGKIRQVLMATHDLTERKRFERALIEADQRKTEFLGLLSHELRNPLTPIRYSLFILDRAEPGSVRAQRAKAIIDRQVDHLARIVDDLLDVSRISRGKIALRRSLFDVGELVRRTSDDYASLFTSKGVEIEIDITKKHIEIDGDPTRIAQVVGNLLQNAAKFTPSGGKVRLTLKADKALQTATLRVRDTGGGISAEALSRLFQPFEQAAETLDRGGLGLGLALVKALVEMHGGKVEAKSRGLGTGAEFVVRLPIKRGRTTSTARPHGAARSPSRRVLIIEDNVDSAQSLREVLKLQKHEVELADNGRDALDKARHFRPDVVFCDIGLPGMDGYQVAKAFRADQRLRSAYLVALTGYALPDDRTKARAAGFDEHLAKPPTLAKLREVLAEGPVRD